MHDSSTNTVSRLKGFYNLFSRYKNCTEILMATTDMTNSTAFELSVDKSMPNHLSTVPVSTEFKTTLDISLIG